VVDAEAGVVRRIESRLLADLGGPSAGGSKEPFRLQIQDSWEFERLRENRDVEFREAVASAIRSGADWLAKQLDNPNQPELRGGVDNDRSYGTGRLALVLLALVHAELPRDHPALVRGFDELRKRELRDTYSTAHAIMALEALWAPRGEGEELRSGSLDRPRRRQPAESDQQLLATWTETLLRNIDSRVDRAYALRFNYVPGPRYDHSVQQYALLGLYSAHLCGVPISPTVWNAAASHLIEDQSDPLGTHDLTLTSYRQLEEIRAGRTTTAAPRPTPIAGWGYQEPTENGVERPVYLAMTCAGISGLTICLAGLRDAGLTRAALERDADQAVRQGFAWIADNFTLHWHGKRVHQPYYWVYYALYGLERACELSGIARIDDRDWYWEGALTLLDLQSPDGSWPTESGGGPRHEQTAMAILFLKQASLPVYTGR
jgi:hypothetical protein